MAYGSPRDPSLRCECKTAGGEQCPMPKYKGQATCFFHSKDPKTMEKARAARALTHVARKKNGEAHKAEEARKAREKFLRRSKASKAVWAKRRETVVSAPVHVDFSKATVKATGILLKRQAARILKMTADGPIKLTDTVKSLVAAVRGSMDAINTRLKLLEKLLGV